MNPLSFYKKEETPITRKFFSNENVNTIHEIIIRRMLTDFNTRISRQSDRDLIALMTSTFNLHHNFKIENVNDEISKLNAYVVSEAIESITSGILMYEQYIKDASELPVPMPRGSSTNIDKSLEFNKPF